MMANIMWAEAQGMGAIGLLLVAHVYMCRAETGWWSPSDGWRGRCVYPPEYVRMLATYVLANPSALPWEEPYYFLLSKSDVAHLRFPHGDLVVCSPDGTQELHAYYSWPGDK